MTWKDQLKDDSPAWLLEKEQPGARYLALRDLYDLQAEDADLRTARRTAHKQGPIAEILARMEAEGYWVKPGTGYSPKYRSTIWSLILLAQLGAQAEEDKRLRKACDYVLRHTLTEGGQFSLVASGAPSGTADCLQGNLCWALSALGIEDVRLERAYEWMARSLTGEGVAPMEEKDAPVRYYAYKRGPNFICGVNNSLPCAWGGVKVMLAFGRLPADKRSALIKRAIKKGLDFFMAVDPATADYPNGYSDKPNGGWWKFGFPVFYVTDVLQIAEALAGLNHLREARLKNLIELIRSKQDDQGRWPLEYDYAGKTWVDFGKKRAPNKWVTLRALRVLKAVG